MALSRSLRKLLLLSSLIPISIASISPPEIQPIVGFSYTCNAAYSTTLDSCNREDFRGIGGAGSCSQECIDQLTSLVSIMIRACQGQTVDRRTLIGHFFLGDAPQFLCGSNQAATETTTSTSVASFTETSTSLTTSTTVSTATTSTSTESGTTSSETATSTSQSSTSTSSTSESIFTTSSVSISLITSTTSASTSSTTTGAGTQQTGESGGGSPFDIFVPQQSSAAIHSSQRVNDAVLLILTLLLSVFILR